MTLPLALKLSRLQGNVLANSISGGIKNDSIFGATGNDSILGNAGNDKLYGDAGNDTFIYTTNEGTDNSFKSSKYSDGDLTLSINSGGKIIFDDVASTTKFNINESYYNISGSKLEKK